MAGLTPRGRNRWGITPVDFFRNFFDDDMFESYFNNALMPMWGFRRGFRADIKETDNEYIVEAELPGMKKDQIEIDFNNNILTISARRNDVVDEERDNYIRRERRYGEMRRSFTVENVREDEIRAEYNDGILKITMPKQNTGMQKRRRIDIH
ncbi:MAG: hypothetical protein PWP31_944 [Clostridia bacterium]|nr:hypothetical protein [Clostridia bacterium]